MNILEQHPEVTLVHTAWNNYDEVLKRVVSISHSDLRKEIVDGNEMIEKVFTQNGISAVHHVSSGILPSIRMVCDIPRLSGNFQLETVFPDPPFRDRCRAALRSADHSAGDADGCIR